MATKKAVAQCNGVESLYLAKLEQSQIGEALAKKLKFKLRSRQQPAPPGIPSPSGGFTIPYFDLKGKSTNFWRYRYLEDADAGGFGALAEGKKLRYVQAPGSLNELYLPPLVDWDRVAENSAQPIIITEGELKSACATAYTEFPTIGLGGVWCWRSASHLMPMLPMFDKFEWDDRLVYIVFDSDAMTNPKVLGAQNALARELMNRGALPYIGRIFPDGENKMGLDDFIVKHGAAAVATKIVKGASEFLASAELHRLNEEVVYVQDPGVIIKLETGQRIAPRAFCDHAYSTRVFNVTTEGPKGGTKMVEKSAPREWLKWSFRAEVSRAVYEPGKARIHNKQLNVWPGWGCEPKKGSIAPWKQLLDHLFGKNLSARTWFERWCACPIQNPGVKMYSSPLLWGLVHGTGKSFVGYSLFKVYGRNCSEIKNEHLQASHNEWAENKQFIMGDEISGGDKRSTSDGMKSIITQQTVRLNPKYIPSYEIRDCLNYYFTSNHPDAFFLEDRDRRFFIWEVTAEPLPDSFYHEYEAWIGSPLEVGPGASALFHHLLHLDMGDFDARTRAPMTASKRDMMSLGRSDLGTWVAMLKESPETVLRMGDIVSPFALWRAEELLQMYDPEGKSRVTVNGLSRELRRQGFKQCYGGQGVITKNGQMRVWEIRPIERKIAESNKAGAYYDDERKRIGAKFK